MANLMHRFLRNQSCLRKIPKLATTTYPLTHQKPCISNIVESVVSVEFDPVPLTNPVINVAGTKSLRFYPSYPIGYGFNPTLVKDDSGSSKTAVVEEEDEKETLIYADSVKKKRKKKMNKHKYMKLRKRLGFISSG